MRSSFLFVHHLNLTNVMYSVVFIALLFYIVRRDRNPPMSMNKFDRFENEWSVRNLFCSVTMTFCIACIYIFPDLNDRLTSVCIVLYVGQMYTAMDFAAKMFGHGLGRVPSLDRALAGIRTDRPVVHFSSIVPNHIPSRKELEYASWDDHTFYHVRTSGHRPLCILELHLMIECVDKPTIDAYKNMNKRMGRMGYVNKEGLLHNGQYVVASTGTGNVPRIFHPIVFWTLALLMIDWPYRMWIKTITDRIPLRVSKRMSVNASLANTPTGRILIEMDEKIHS